jgi:hypothetical protein
MKRNYLLLMLLVILTGLLAMSCSSSAKDVPTGPEIPEENNGFVDWGDYTLKVDLENEQAEIVFDRESNIHYNVTSLLAPPACGGSGCLLASFVSYNPSNYELVADFELTNPTDLRVSDVRLIFTDINEITYPQKLNNLDGLTNTFGGQAKSFLAFKKSDPDRFFNPYDVDTVTAHIRFPPGSPLFINFKLTAFLWQHCGDPYEISNMKQDGFLFEHYGSSTISCRVKDWQDDVSSVSLNCIPITGSIESMVNTHDDIWEVEIENNNNRPASLWQFFIKAESPNPQGIDAYNIIHVNIYNYGWHDEGTWLVPNNNGDHDIGVFRRPGESRGNILRAYRDDSSYVSIIPGLGAGAQVTYTDLENLDPNYPDFQPWPPKRIDAAFDGAFGWTNLNYDLWHPDYKNSDTLSFLQNTLIFDYEPLSDDNRAHISASGYMLRAYDVCDTFNARLCGLYARAMIYKAAINITEGPGTGRHKYLDSDRVILAGISWVGMGEGFIDPDEIVGFDVMEAELDGDYIVFIAEEKYSEIEIYIAREGFNYVLQEKTIHISYSGYTPEPLDVELLPPNPGFALAPDVPLLCVLINTADVGGSTGSMVLMYNALTYDAVCNVGTPSQPLCAHTPVYLDTDDDNYGLYIAHQSASNQYITQWTYYAEP